LNYFHWPSEDLLEQWVNIYNTLDENSQNCPCKKTTLLHIASRYGIVDLLLATLRILNEMDIVADSKDEHGVTPLSWAAESGHEAVVRLLLSTGKVEADLKDTEYGQTPLSWAAENGYEAVVRLLLSTGKVEADSKDNGGRTPLSWAARNGHEAVRLLLSTGKAEADLRDNDGQTPLLWAARNGFAAIVELLHKHIN